ncbi:hypothetical protein [Thiohalobacter thiocyanaticus]|nr:hypothetical protein [Thiohalobacter thiocyanaticus]
MPALLAAESAQYQPASARMLPALEALSLTPPGSAGRPAGSRGRVISRGDQLFFEDGTRARFWGVGLTFSGWRPIAFPPPKEDVEDFVYTLKSYGFNLVRFVGIDNSLPSLCEYWKKYGHFGGPVMDRLDYLVAELVESGIYYSFSINNSSLCPLDAFDGDHTNDHPQSWRRYHGKRLIRPYMVRRQTDWIADFFAHKNPYTDKTYAEDPANVYLAAVNEDSVWSVYFRDNKYLSKQDRLWLDEDFRDWLNSRRSIQDRKGTEASTAEAADFSLWRPRWLLSRDQRKLIYSYLAHADARLVTELKDRLRAIGYQGLITPTNNWYGYGALDTASRHGDYVEVHGYFDHPMGADREIEGKSFLMRDEGFAGIDKTDWSFPLTKAARSALPDKPLIMGEWNHAAWSPYAYEGPFLMYAYSALQDYAGLVAHTWFPYPESRNGPDVELNAFSVSTNPLFLRLSPILSAAWLGHCLKPHAEVLEVGLGDSFGEVVDRTFAVEMGPDPAVKVGDGFHKLMRVRFPHSPVIDLKSDAGSDPGVIRLSSQMSAAAGWAAVEGDCVAGAVFSGQGGVLDLAGGVSIRMNEQGSVVAVALDGRRIADSSDLAVTLVGSPAIAWPEGNGERMRFRQPAGTTLTAGAVSASLSMPKTGECPQGQWVGGQSRYDKMIIQSAKENNLCVIQVESRNGAWVRLREGDVLVSTE